MRKKLNIWPPTALFASYLGKTSGQVSRVLKRLRNHGLIKKAGNTYKYYLTTLGRQVVTTSLKLKELFIIPNLRGQMHFA